jgi:hypothetical protein
VEVRVIFDAGLLARLLVRHIAEAVLSLLLCALELALAGWGV